MTGNTTQNVFCIPVNSIHDTKCHMEWYLSDKLYFARGNDAFYLQAKNRQMQFFLLSERTFTE